VIREIHGASCRSQATKLGAEIVRLIADEGVQPEQITVLVATSSKASYYRELTSIPLPARVRWATEVHNQPKTVLIETATRFKGLESPIVFLWGIDKVDPSIDRELLYVSLSRAKSKLCLVSTPAACSLIRSFLEDPRTSVPVEAHG
jgi:superfamily I DNA/RNA helicase